MQKLMVVFSCILRRPILMLWKISVYNLIRELLWRTPLIPEYPQKGHMFVTAEGGVVKIFPAICLSGFAPVFCYIIHQADDKSGESAVRLLLPWSPGPAHLKASHYYQWSPGLLWQFYAYHKLFLTFIAVLNPDWPMQAVWLGDVTVGPGDWCHCFLSPCSKRCPNPFLQRRTPKPPSVKSVPSNLRVLHHINNNR